MPVPTSTDRDDGAEPDVAGARRSHLDAGLTQQEDEELSQAHTERQSDDGGQHADDQGLGRTERRT
jgi:hypothetical protein